MSGLFAEALPEAWRLRFGGEPPSSLFAEGRFLNHRSVRDFSDRPVDEETVSWLVGCAQSAATSSNLQLWTVISIQESENRDKLVALCANQRQVSSAPWFFAFLADHFRIRNLAVQAGEDPAGLDYVEFFAMAVVDVALAAERLVCAAESVGLGTCYVGALRNDAAGVEAALALPKGVFGLFGLCLGWPAENAKAEIKPRLPQSVVWHRERYDTTLNLLDFEERSVAFNASQGMDPTVTWAKRSGRRVDGEHMTGREALRAYLDRHEMGLR